MTNLQIIASKIKSRFDLCGFAGNSEAEHIIAQTVINAAGNNGYSLKGSNLSKGRQRCGTDNAAGLSLVKAQGWIIEETHPTDGQVLKPTDTLLSALKDHLKRTDNITKRELK